VGKQALQSVNKLCSAA